MKRLLMAFLFVLVTPFFGCFASTDSTPRLLININDIHSKLPPLEQATKDKINALLSTATASKDVIITPRMLKQVFEIAGISKQDGEKLVEELIDTVYDRYITGCFHHIGQHHKNILGQSITKSVNTTFSDIQANKGNAEHLALEYLYTKCPSLKNKRITVSIQSKTVNDILLSDKIVYEMRGPIKTVLPITFAFKDIDESVDSTINTNVIKGVCTGIHGTDFAPSGFLHYDEHTNYGIIATQTEHYDASCNANQELCTKINNTLEPFGFVAHYAQDKGLSKYNCHVRQNKITDPENLAKIAGIDNFTFCAQGLQLQSDSDWNDALKRYIATQISPLNSFRCNPPQQGAYHGPGCPDSNNDILRCYINDEPIDFIFDDLSENFEYKDKTARSAMECNIAGGVFAQESCALISQEKCTEIIKNISTYCPNCKGAKWDESTKTCILHDGQSDRTISEATIIGIEIGGALFAAFGTLVTGGSSWIIAAELIGSTMVISGQIAIDNMVKNFIEQANQCNNAACAEQLIVDNFQTLAQTSDSGDFTAAEIVALDSVFAYLLNLIPADSDFYKKMIDKDMTIHANQSDHFWQMTGWEWVRAAGIVLSMTSLATDFIGKISQKVALNRTAKILQSKIDDLFKGIDPEWVRAYNTYASKDMTIDEFMKYYDNSLEIMRANTRLMTDIPDYLHISGQINHYRQTHGITYIPFDDIVKFNDLMRQHPELERLIQQQLKIFNKDQYAFYNWKNLIYTEGNDLANKLWREFNNEITNISKRFQAAIADVDNLTDVDTQAIIQLYKNKWIEELRNAKIRLSEDALKQIPINEWSKSLVKNERALQYINSLIDNDSKLLKRLTNWDSLSKSERLSLVQDLSRVANKDTGVTFNIAPHTDYIKDFPNETLGNWYGLYHPINNKIYINLDREASDVINTLIHETEHNFMITHPWKTMLNDGQRAVSQLIYDNASPAYFNSLNEISSFAVGNNAGQLFNRITAIDDVTLNALGIEVFNLMVLSSFVAYENSHSAKE